MRFYLYHFPFSISSLSKTRIESSERKKREGGEEEEEAQRGEKLGFRSFLRRIDSSSSSTTRNRGGF